MLSVIKKYIFFIVLHFPKNGDLCLQNEKLHEEWKLIYLIILHCYLDFCAELKHSNIQCISAAPEHMLFSLTQTLYYSLFLFDCRLLYT